MKETAKIHLELLKKKEANLVKTLADIEAKFNKLEEQYDSAEKSLERIRQQIANFGVSRPRSQSSTTVEESSIEDNNSSKSSAKVIEKANYFG